MLRCLRWVLHQWKGSAKLTILTPQGLHLNPAQQCSGEGIYRGVYCKHCQAAQMKKALSTVSSSISKHVVTNSTSDDDEGPLKAMRLGIDARLDITWRATNKTATFKLTTVNLKYLFTAEEYKAGKGTQIISLSGWISLLVKAYIFNVLEKWYAPRHNCCFCCWSCA